MTKVTAVDSESNKCLAVSIDLSHVLPLPQVSLRQICLHNCYLYIFELVTCTVCTDSQQGSQTLQLMQVDL